VSCDDSNEAAMKSGLCEWRNRGRVSGFTVVELLIAMTITLLIAGAIAGVTQPARDAFDRVPADLDLQQRGRMAIEVMSQALRSAGRNVAAADRLGSLSDLVPVASVFEPDESGEFTSLEVIVPATDAAQGVLAADQAGAAAAITLAVAPCPDVRDVCGFTPGSTALIADGLGQFDVFSIASTDPGARRFAPAIALSRAYPTGSIVVEVDRSTFSLALQPDGSHSLVRETAAGAVQPIVDFVSGLSFLVSGRDVAAGFFQIDQVEVWVSVEARTEALRLVVPDRVFRTSIRLRNAS
jgi:type II secretory pathway pseudopilin PulG